MGWLFFYLIGVNAQWQPQSALLQELLFLEGIARFIK